MERWINRVALVTGASSGIGGAICKALLKQGMTVVGCARNTAEIESAESLGKLHPIKCDVTRESDILNMFNEIRRKFDRLDVCVNNSSLLSASFRRSGMKGGRTETLEAKILDPCKCILEEALDLMKETNISDGQIIQMGCIDGHEVTYKDRGDILPIYGMQYATRVLIESLRRQSEASNVRVATISSGPETHLNMSVARDLPHGVDRPSVSGVHPFTDMFPSSHFAAFQDLTGTAFDSLCKTLLASEHNSDIAEVLKIEDVVDAVLYILKSPPCVNVADIIVQHIESRE